MIIQKLPAVWPSGRRAYYNNINYINLGEETMCASEKPDIKAVIRNLKKPVPFWQKLGLITKNSLIKITKFQNCCGHPGEPGC